MKKSRETFWMLILLFVTGQAIALEHTINDAWRFVQNDDLTIEAVDSVHDWRLVNLPHTWNQHDPFDEIRGYVQGIGWYVKDVMLEQSEKSQVFLKFEGANQVAEVYVNGQKAGEHVGGYTAFVVDVSKFVVFDSINRIAVKVDNRYNADVPPLTADFTFFGGIYRDVWLLRKQSVHFDLSDRSTKGVYISTPEVSAQKATLMVRANVRSQHDSGSRILLETRLFDEKSHLISESSKRVRIGKYESFEFQDFLELSQPKLWSPDSPYLYTTEITLRDERSGAVLDQTMVKTGFRWFEMDENRAFLLNGAPIKLIGVNRHQDFEGLGNALPDRLHLRDVELLKQMGGNFLRIAHYPQDPAVLEACDRLGILVWEEIPVVNSITVSAAFQANSETMLKEMIRQHFNHPSVIMWGLMNEVLLQFNKGLRDHPHLKRSEYLSALNQFTSGLNDLAKREDPARFTALANHLNYDLYQEAGLNDITDIVGWNVYYGWYREDMERAGEFMDQFHAMHPSKGIIISEYGGDGDRRLHAVEPRRFDFSIEWETAIHAAYYRQILERPHVMGGAAWVFADFSSEGRKDAVPTINSKGLVNYDRSLKDPYLFYQAALSQQPYLQIGSLDWELRKGFANDQGVLAEPVFVFSNAQSVEVRVGDLYLGNFPVTDFHARVMVPFQHGENIVSVKGDSDLAHTKSFKAQVIPKDLRGLVSKDIGINMNLGAHFHFVDLVTREVWLPEKAYQKGSIGFVDGKRLMTWRGMRVGTDVPITGSENEPIYQTHRDSISLFKADVPDGWYEITLHLAEIYSSHTREVLANNLGAEGDEIQKYVDRAFQVYANEKEVLKVQNLTDFCATIYRFQVRANDKKGITLEFKPLRGSAFVSAISVRGL